MSGRAVAYVALLANLAICCTAMRAQNTSIYVEVSDRNQSDYEEVEKRMTPELVRELNSASSDALLLYTEYTAKAGKDLKEFMRNISDYVQEGLSVVEQRPYNVSDNCTCQKEFQHRLKKIELDAYRGASFSGENHHKFLLGHMVVFRMHLNKTEEYIRKCDRALYGCGAPCENQPKVKRWKRLANEEIHRLKDDLQHTRRSYKDLVVHAKRRLNHLKKLITIRTGDAVEEYHRCLDSLYNYN